MKVLQVIPSVSFAHGGPSHAIRKIERTLMSRGVDVETATTDDDGPGRRADFDGETWEPEGVTRHYFGKRTEFYKIAPAFVHWMFSRARDYDLIHIHALFSFTSVVAAWAARRAGVPYIVRPLGVLNKYGMTQRRAWLKRLSVRFIEGPILSHAAAVHFTAQAEMDEARHIGVPIHGFVIPLGVEPMQQGNKSRFLAAHPALSASFRLLFLSRIDPKKNLEGILHAIPLLRSEVHEIALIVAGDGDADYVSQLHALAARLGVSGRVTWIGHVEGTAKADVFAASDLFILPSHSENFGIALVEALSAGLPCVVGRGVAIAGAVEDAGAGLAVDTDAASIAAGIRHYLNSPAVRSSAGCTALDLAKREYSIEKMGKRLDDLYTSVLAQVRSKPCQ